jgi:hypothetical protein
LLLQRDAAAGSGADAATPSIATLVEILLDCADELDASAARLAAVEVPSSSRPAHPSHAPPPVPVRPVRPKKASRRGASGGSCSKTIATLNAVKAVAERDRVVVPHGHSILDKVKAVAERSTPLSAVAAKAAHHRHPPARATAEPRPPPGPPPVPVLPRKKKKSKKKRRASELAAATASAAAAPAAAAEQKVEDLPVVDVDPWLLEDRVASLRLRSSAAVLADTASTGSLRLTVTLVPHVHTKYCDRVKHVCPFESGHLRSGSAHDAATATRFVEGEVLCAEVMFKGRDVTEDRGLACRWWRLPSVPSTPRAGGGEAEEEEGEERVLVGSEPTYRMAAADACCFIQLECTYAPGEGKAGVRTAARPRGPVVPGRPAVHDIAIRCPDGDAVVGGTLEATGRCVALHALHALHAARAARASPRFASSTRSLRAPHSPPSRLTPSPLAATLESSPAKEAREAARAAGGGCASPRTGSASSCPPRCFAPHRVSTTSMSAAASRTVSSTPTRGRASKCVAFRRARTASWGKRSLRAPRRRSARARGRRPRLWPRRRPRHRGCWRRLRAPIGDARPGRRSQC